MRQKKSYLFRQTPGDIQAQLDAIKVENDLETLKTIVDKVQTPDVRKAAQVRFNDVSVLQNYADEINGLFANATASIIETGRALIKAKERLPRGHWRRIFKGHPDAIKNPLLFTVNTAQRLMKIARHPILAKAAHAQLLPPSWATLHQLTRLDATILENALVDGRIHPAMQRKDVLRLAVPRQTKDSYDDQVEALTRQIDTASDPVAEKYARDALAEYLAKKKKPTPPYRRQNQPQFPGNVTWRCGLHV